ncbi:MarR family winged helix-turn-helix transcriptional regulator [Rhodoferax ferrireducens]|uniref:MarR family winged helix-turn-helix transcriptional regulator n=1 Tax=Rhodoferax ferrireducens TaxID=192843 RepID=UPI000E0DDE52|nr:MarR family winged helix-turn-helix transcriptional regulator [Rhodoferax ferrireducens]
MEALTCNCSSLRSAARTLTQAYDEVLRPSGLRVTQFSILARLAAVGEVNIAEFSHMLAMDRTTLARNLRPLERENLVLIRVGQDRRERLIGLSRAGEAVLNQALPLWKSVHERFESMFGQERARNLRKQLGDVTQAGRALYEQDRPATI